MIDTLELLAQTSSSEGGDSFFGWVLGIAILAAMVWFLAVKPFKASQETDQKLGVSAGERADRKLGFGYLGGHPGLSQPYSNVTLVFTSKDFGIERPTSGLLIRMPLTDVVSIAVETEEEIRRRITATRLVLTGIFAVAWKKRTAGSVLVTIETRDGPFVFEKAKASKSEVLRMFAKQTASLGSRNDLPASGPAKPVEAEAASTDRSVKERLSELEGLRESGLISESEHAERREAILKDL